MRVVVVEHDAEFILGIALRDFFEEIEELGLAVPVVAAVGDFASSDFQGRKQRCCPVALVGVGFSGNLGRSGSIG